MMVRDFQRVIGLEARAQVLERTGRLPDAVAACVGGGSNAIGIFHAFLDDPGVRLVGFEAGGDGVETGRHARDHHRRLAGRAARRADRTCCRTRTGRPSSRTRSRPGLDYPGVGPEHALARGHSAGPSTGRSPTPRRWTRSRCSAAPRGSSRRSSRAHAIAGALRAGPRAGAGRDHPGEPVRPRRQGRRHRREVVRDDRRGRAGDADGTAIAQGSTSEPAAGTVASDSAVTVAFARTCSPVRAEAGRAGRLPARRLPDRRRLGRAVRRDDRGRLRPRRGRHAVLRPRDGRPDDPGRRGHGAARRRSGCATSSPSSSGSAAAGGAAVVMTYFNPVLRYGVDAFARDLAAAGGLGVITPDLIPDEADEWLAASDGARPGPDLPGRAVVDRGADRLDRRREQRVPLRDLDDGRHRRPRHRATPPPRRSSPGAARTPPCRSASGSGVRSGEQAARGRRVRRRGDRRLGAGVRGRAARAGRRARAGGRAGGRRAPRGPTGRRPAYA